MIVSILNYTVNLFLTLSNEKFSCSLAHYWWKASEAATYRLSTVIMRFTNYGINLSEVLYFPSQLRRASDKSRTSADLNKYSPQQHFSQRMPISALFTEFTEGRLGLDSGEIEIRFLFTKGAVVSIFSIIRRSQGSGGKSAHFDL